MTLSWSPNGQLIAFDWGQGVWTVGLDGQPPVRVIPNASNPTFSPDGTELMYVATTTGQTTSDVWIADADGSKARALHFLDAIYAAWSPDGARIAFETDGPNPTCKPCSGDPFSARLWVADLNGQHVTTLHVIPQCCVGAYLGPPVWSPNGQWLAWVGGIATDKLVIVAADGSSARSVAFDSAPVAPTWFQRPAPTGP
jgi:Tol biopolymer transport system component